MKGYRIGGRYANVIKKVLNKGFSVSHLNLSSNKVTTFQLSKMLTQAHQLPQHLDLSHNRITNIDNLSKAISEGEPKLMILNLEDNYINDKSVKQLYTAI
jgi:GDP-D-mannose dehydratase